MPVPIHTLPKCLACCKRTGKPCQQPAMINGRCRLHGGKSTGPKTTIGRKVIAIANMRHGLYTREGLDLWENLLENIKIK